MAGRSIVASPLGPLAKYSVFIDFMNVATGTVMATNANGAGAGNSASASTTRPGVVSTSTGTTATGTAGILSASGFAFSGGEWSFEAEVFISNLSDGTDTYAYYIGFMDTIGAEPADGVYFKYVHGTSANWIMTAANNSSRTSTPSSVAVAAGSWLKLKIVVNAAGTSAEFFVNGVSLGTVTADIPTTSARATSFGWLMVKSVGLTARTVLTDWLDVNFELTTPR